MDYEKNEIPDFPEYSVTNAIKLIEESAEIYFFPRQKMGEHIFGDIHITKYSGHEVDFASELANTDNAKIIDKFIQTGKQLNYCHFSISKHSTVFINYFRH